MESANEALQILAESAVRENVGDEWDDFAKDFADSIRGMNPAIRRRAKFAVRKV